MAELRGQLILVSRLRERERERGPPIPGGSLWAPRVGVPRGHPPHQGVKSQENLGEKKSRKRLFMLLAFMHNPVCLSRAVCKPFRGQMQSEI